MKVLCIGHTAYDITVLTDGYPKENVKYRVEKRIECGGGPASNAAYLLGKWGIKTYIASVVGNDIYGKRIKKEFTDVGVDTTYLELSNKYKTTSSFIIVNKKNASRTVFTYRNPQMRINDMDININPDYILVDAQELELSLKMIKKYPKAITILDAGRAKYANIKLGKIVDYLVTSRNFAEDFTGMKIDINDNNSLNNVYNSLEKDFKGHIVITLEEHGCLYKEDGIVKLMPGYKVIAKDTTGAGDIFHGAFVYALINKYNYADVMRISNIAGALSVREIGGRYSVPDLKEVLRIYEKSK
ncbi:MAG: carbohydrate kinase family protein [Bacilli bacterium]